MKNIIILLILLFIVPINNGQNQKYGYTQTYGEHYWYSPENQYGIHDWNLSNFVWGVSKSSGTVGGNYEYKFWFTSGAYIWDYYEEVAVWKYEHCYDFKIWIDGQLIIHNTRGFTFRELYNEPSLTFISPNPNPAIIIQTNHKIL